MKDSSWDVDNKVFFTDCHWDGDLDDGSYEELYVVPKTNQMTGSSHTNFSNKKSSDKTKKKISLKPAMRRRGRDMPLSTIMTNEHSPEKEIRFYRPLDTPETKDIDTTVHAQLREALRAVKAYR